MTTARGMALKEAGLDRMECTDRYWIRRMRAYALARSQAFGEVCTDHLHKLVEDGEMPPPKKSQAWGAILRGRHWMFLFELPSSWPSNHGRNIDMVRWIE